MDGEEAGRGAGPTMVARGMTVLEADPTGSGTGRGRGGGTTTMDGEEEGLFWSTEQGAVAIQEK